MDDKITPCDFSIRLSDQPAKSGFLSTSELRMHMYMYISHTFPSLASDRMRKKISECGNIKCHNDMQIDNLESMSKKQNIWKRCSLDNYLHLRSNMDMVTSFKINAQYFRVIIGQNSLGWKNYTKTTIRLKAYYVQC